MGKMMLGMTSTPHLLMVVLAVLAVMRGRVDGAMTCWKDTAGPYYLLTDTAKCWAPEINATFDGKLTACSGGLVYADSDAGCYKTIANINKDAKYKGPPLSCGHDRTDGYHWYLAWKSADNCANGITSLMDFSTPQPSRKLLRRHQAGAHLLMEILWSSKTCTMATRNKLHWRTAACPSCRMPITRPGPLTQISMITRAALRLTSTCPTSHRPHRST